MSNPGTRRRRTGFVLLVLAIPTIMIVGVVAAVIGLKVAHSDARWTSVNGNCPALDNATAAALGMAPAPLPDDDSRGAHDTSTVSNCFYSPGDGSNNALQVTVNLYDGGIIRSPHDEAIAAADENPPAGFRPLGMQTATRRFGDRGPGSGRLALIYIVENAQVRVQLYHRDKLADATDAESQALRVPMQAVADQAVTNLNATP